MFCTALFILIGGVRLNVVVNYPTDKAGIDILNERIAEFKAFLIFESIKGLNISSDGKKKVIKELLKGLKSGKYKV